MGASVCGGGGGGETFRLTASEKLRSEEFRSTVIQENDLTLEVPTIFSKLSGWKPVTDFCSNFGCPNLFLSFWTEIVFFGLGTEKVFFGLGTEIGSKKKRLFVFLLGTGSVFPNGLTVE